MDSFPVNNTNKVCQNRNRNSLSHFISHQQRTVLNELEQEERETASNIPDYPLRTLFHSTTISTNLPTLTYAEEYDRELTKSGLAKASRPWRDLKDSHVKKTCGRKRVHDYKPATRINWFNPLLWQQINRAAHQADWNPKITFDTLLEWDAPTFKFLCR